MSQGSTNPANSNAPALDATGNDLAFDAQLSRKMKQLDCTISELLAARGELGLEQCDTQAAVRDFKLALQFNQHNERAMRGKSYAEARPSTDDGSANSATAPASNGFSSIYLSRVESGYRVVAIRPECDFNEESYVISQFGISSDQKRLAILCAKELARDPDERLQMELDDKVTDQHFSAAVQRVHSFIETVALIAPQDQLDSPRTPYLPAPRLGQPMSPVAELRGIWRCLAETIAEKDDSSLTKAKELESFVYAVESTVVTAVSEMDLAKLIEQFENIPSFPNTFEKLFVACQSNGKPAVQDDLARALLDGDDEGVPVHSACLLGGALQAVQESIYAATMETTAPKLAQLPRHFCAVFELDLHAFIYETLLFAVSGHPSLRPQAVSCA